LRVPAEPSTPPSRLQRMLHPTMLYPAGAAFFEPEQLHWVPFAEHVHTQNASGFWRIAGWLWCWLKCWLIGIDAAGWGFLSDFRRINLGQTADVACMEKAFREMMSSADKPDKVLIYAISRGGQAALNWLALHPHPEVQGLIIEGGLPHLELLLKWQRSWLARWTRVGKWLLTHFALYDLKGPHGIESVCHIKNKDLPILLVYSKGDLIVPHHCGLELHAALTDANFTEHHLLILKEGGHDAYLSASPDCRRLYIKTVHDFMRTYDLF